jgi:hypothetical protein
MPTPVTVHGPKPKPVPLAKGEVRQAIKDTWRVMGIIGLRWRSIVRRALRS